MPGRTTQQTVTLIHHFPGTTEVCKYNLRGKSADGQEQGQDIASRKSCEVRSRAEGKYRTMALHPDFPSSPYEIPRPDQRGFPASEDLRNTAYENLLPPLVATIREEVSAWRDAGYQGASPTSRALVQWWFLIPHQVAQGLRPCGGSPFHSAGNTGAKSPPYVGLLPGEEARKLNEEAAG
jgi:hypothetical protein